MELAMHRSLFTSFATEPEQVTISPDLAAHYRLEEWAEKFALGTAGYRDLLDPEDFFNPEVPFNGVTLAVMLAARAQLACERYLRRLHVGGEVRAHTQELIDLAARIYAASGLDVHLRPSGERTTPIWLSSFGVFFEELDGGENFTASHSQSFKGGWKPMDEGGGQLLEMAPRIAERVRELAAQAASTGLNIALASSNDPRILRDFDPILPYCDVLGRVVPADLLAQVPAAAAKGFRAAFCTEGGSMAPAARRVFSALGIEHGPDGPVFFTHEEESPTYHGIGILDGVNHGVDPGKWQVYRHVGAQDILRSGSADIFFIWDPDGDRFNMVTIASADLADRAAAAGLEVEDLDENRCLVYFKPNQIYFLLTAAKTASLAQTGELDRYDWIVASTWPTSRSIGEVAEAFTARGGARLATFRTPVGFKYFAVLVASLEEQLAAGSDPCSAVDVTGERTEFGIRPRLLIMAEESGGAACGPAEPVRSRTGRRISLAPKEKDAMQIGVLSLCLAARLFREGRSFAGYYLDLLEEYRVRWRFYERRDVTLFDESLQGRDRDEAQAAGNRRKDATVAFFASLQGLAPSAVAAELLARLPEGVTLPPIERCFHAGDGTLLEMTGMWFELRASGTDAVLRYYMEGENDAEVSALNEAFTRLRIAAG
jgi:phosphomannomutase